jgi:hypothetical protein
MADNIMLQAVCFKVQVTAKPSTLWLAGSIKPSASSAGDFEDLSEARYFQIRLKLGL